MVYTISDLQKYAEEKICKYLLKICDVIYNFNCGDGNALQSKRVQEVNTVDQDYHIAQAYNCLRILHINGMNSGYPFLN